jgi:predicted DNA-binding antitoxin AbrB/MazE fold protein
MNSLGREDCSDFEKSIRKYLKQGRDKLSKDLAGTREAIKLIAEDKTRDFMRVMDKGLDKNERSFLSELKYQVCTNPFAMAMA